MASMVIWASMAQYNNAFPHADPRTRHWPLVWNSACPVWALTLAYLALVVQGPRIMSSRKPLNLKWFMVVYNLGLVGLSGYMFVELFLSTRNAGYGWECAAYNAETRTRPAELRVAKVLWWYFFSKAIELLDTVCMILRKKFDQVSFLHVFHHASMLNIWWWNMMFIPGGLSWFGAWVNCLVHVVMYLYYGLSAIPELRSKLWWKRYITKLQLAQFVVIFIHSANSIRACSDFPRWGKNLLVGYTVILFVLFRNFYSKAYTKKGTNSKPSLSSSSAPLSNKDLPEPTRGAKCDATSTHHGKQE